METASYQVTRLRETVKDVVALGNQNLTEEEIERRSREAFERVVEGIQVARAAMAAGEDPLEALRKAREARIQGEAETL